MRVDVGGYQVSFDQRGSGSPPVVFVSALGEPGSAWDPVIARLTAATEVFTYERAGMGLLRRVALSM